VARADGQRDQPTNLAYAYSHDCASGCESIAVAYQVVLVNNNSSSQAPQNAAVAINDNCSGCATFGYADQYAVDVPPGTHLSPRARSQLGQIAQQANQDIRAGMPFSELDSDLKSLAGQLQQDVDNDLAQQNVPAHHPHDSQTTTEHGAPGSPPTG
jgi:putative peptide zinc metalloprotease protein